MSSKALTGELGREAALQRTRRLVRRRRSLVVVKYACVIGFAIIAVLVPLWMLLVNSAKSFGEANQLSLALPHKWELTSNYSTVYHSGRVLTGLMNTLLLAVPSIIGVLILGSMAAWIFARGKSRTLQVLYYASIVGLIVPPAVVTTVYVLRKLSLFNSHLGLILLYMGILMSFAIFFMTGFVKTIPIELEEAARIDGAKPLRIFCRVILPLLKPIVLTTFIIALLVVWNDFFWPFYVLDGQQNQTLTLGLFNFYSQYQYAPAWNLIFADVVLVSLPLVFVYFLAQRKIVGGLMGGAVNR